MWIKAEGLHKALTSDSSFMALEEKEQNMYCYCPGHFSGPGMKQQFVHSVFFAAQVLQKLGEEEAAADCCERTLKYQRETPGFQKVEMIKNAVDLTRYFTRNNRFTRSYSLFSEIKQLIAELLAPLRTYDKTKSSGGEEGEEAEEPEKEIPELQLNESE